MKQTEITQIYEKYLPNVYRYAYSKLGNKAEAEDATSEAFLAFIQKYETVNDPHAWLIGVCRNIIYKKFRDKPEIQEIDAVNEVSSDIKAVEDEAIESELLAEIKRSLQKLDEVTREIITLKIWEELKFNEIAEILSVSENTVKAKYYRGLEELAQKQTKLRAVSLPLLLLAIPQLASAAEYNPSSAFINSLKSKLIPSNLTNLTTMQRVITKLSTLPIAGKIVIAVILLSIVVGAILLGVYVNQPKSPGSGNNQSSTTIPSTTTSEEVKGPDRIAYLNTPDNLTTEVWVVSSDGNGKEMLYSEKVEFKHLSNLSWKTKGELTFVECTYSYSTDKQIGSFTCAVINYNLATKQIVQEITFEKGSIRDFTWSPNGKDYAYSFTSDRLTTVPGGSYESNAVEFHYVKDGIDNNLVLAGVVIGNDRMYEVELEVNFSVDGKFIVFSDYFAYIGKCPTNPTATNPCSEFFRMFMYNSVTGEGRWVYDEAYAGNQTLIFTAIDGSKLVYEDLSRDAFYSYEFGSGNITELGKISSSLRAQLMGSEKVLINESETVQNVGVINKLSEYTNGVNRVGDNLYGFVYLEDGSILATSTQPQWLEGQIPAIAVVTGIVKITKGETSILTEISNSESVIQLSERMNIVVEPRQ